MLCTSSQNNLVGRSSKDRPTRLGVSPPTVQLAMSSSSNEEHEKGRPEQYDTQRKESVVQRPRVSHSRIGVHPDSVPVERDRPDDQEHESRQCESRSRPDSYSTLLAVHGAHLPCITSCRIAFPFSKTWVPAVSGESNLEAEHSAPHPSFEVRRTSS